MAIFIYSSGDPGNPNSYILSPIIPGCGFPLNSLCYVISADNGTGHPVIDDPLLVEIVIALNTRTSSVRVKLKP